MIIKPTNVYVDEAGFTGDDLLSKDQPYFILAGVAADDEFVSDFIANFRQTVPTQSEELKGKNYAKSSAFKSTFRTFLEKLESRCKIVIADKRYIACSKFFEYAIEPGVKQNNIILYKNDFHRFMANFFYFFTLAGNEDASDVLSLFVRALRGGPEALKEFGHSLGTTGDPTKDPMQAVIKIAQRTWLSSYDEMDALIGDSGRLKWVLDATTNCMASLMRDFSTPSTMLRVTYDASKPMAEAGHFFDAFVNRPDLTTTIGPLGHKPIGFNLSQPMASGDSKIVLGIQVADVAAGIVNRLAKENRLEAEKELLIPILSDECLFPDPSFVDLDNRSAMANAVILTELADAAGSELDIMARVPFTYELLEAFDPRDGLPSRDELASWAASRG